MRLPECHGPSRAREYQIDSLREDKTGRFVMSLQAGHTTHLVSLKIAARTGVRERWVLVGL